MKKLVFLLIGISVVFTTYSQTGKKPAPKSKGSATMEVVYTCPMHPEVTSNKPGKCPKCGMDLIRSKKEQMKMDVMKIYTCPMHPDVTSDKPGKCPKCGMDLVEKKTDDKSKMEK